MLGIMQLRISHLSVLYIKRKEWNIQNLYFVLFCVGLKLGPSHQGKNKDCGWVRTVCLGECLDLSGTKWQEAGEKVMINSARWTPPNIIHHHLIGFTASVGAARSPDLCSILLCPGTVHLEGSSHSLPFLRCQSKKCWAFLFPSFWGHTF